MRVKSSKVFFCTIFLFLISIPGIVFYYDSFIGTASKITFLATGLLLVFGFSTARESSKMLKFNKQSYDSVYEWSNDLTGGHLLIKNLLSEMELEESILINLNNIKTKILFYCNHDISNLRLLNAYFEVFKEEKEKETYFKLVIGIAASVVLLYLRTPSYNPLPIFNKLTEFTPVELLVSFIIFLAYFINVTYLGNKRVRIIQAIIKECIEDLK
jgi:hypothetical protein